MRTDHIPDTWTIEKDKWGRIVCYDEQGTQRCGGYNKTDGLPCKKKPKEGNVRCTRFHNGNAKKGIEAPNYKHGNNSRYKHLMPQRLAERFQDALQDKELMSIRSKVALLDLQLGDLIEQWESGDFGSMYNDIAKRYYAIRSLLEKFKRSNVGSDASKIIFGDIEDLFDDLGQIIENQKGQFELRSEMRDIIQDMNNLIKSDAQITYMGERAVAVKELGLFFLGIRKLVDRANLDTEQRRFLSEGLMTLWNYQYQIEERVEDEN